MIRVLKMWRPASVVLPDKRQLHRVAVYITNTDLVVFDRPGDPEWSSPVDFAATVEPRKSRPHVGVDIHTEAGLVVITPTGQCMSCGSRLRTWSPEWASNVGAWPGEVTTSWTE